MEQNIFHVNDLDGILLEGDNVGQEVNEVTSIQDTTIHTCNSCEKRYASARGLKRHVKAKHTVIEDPCFLDILEFKETNRVKCTKALAGKICIRHTFTAKNFGRKKFRTKLFVRNFFFCPKFFSVRNFFCPKFFPWSTKFKFKTPHPVVCGQFSGQI